MRLRSPCRSPPGSQRQPRGPPGNSNPWSNLPEGKQFPASRHAGLNKARQRLEDQGSEFAVEDNITNFIFQ